MQSSKPIPDGRNGSRVVDDVGVPRRFGVGRLMVIVAIYSALFGLLRLVEVHPLTFALIALFFTAIGLAQMLLFRGTRPRAASHLVGAGIVPLLFLVAVLSAKWFGWAGFDTRFLGKLTVAQIAVLLVYLVPVGFALGYAAGVLIAGIFLVLDRRWDARNLWSTPLGTEPEDSTEEATPRGFRAVGKSLLDSLSRSPGRKRKRRGIKRPLRTALAISATQGTFLALAAPFFPWPWWAHLLGSLLVAFLVGFAGTGLSLCNWRAAAALVLLGPIGAFGPVTALRRLHLGMGMSFRDFLPLVSAMVVGALLGLLAASVAGWARWLLWGNDGREKTRRATIRLYIAVGIGLAALYGGLTLWLDRQSRQPWQAALTFIEGSGGQAIAQSFWGPVDIVSLNRADVNDLDLKLLTVFRRITMLTLSETHITDAGLVHLKGLGRLAYLNLSGSPVTGAGLEHLGGMASLTDLRLDDCPVTDAGLAHVSQLQGLAVLSLGGTRVTDAGLVHLGGLGRLQDLNLSGSAVTGVGLRHLGGMVNLRWLRLNGCPVTDAGLAYVPQLQGLISLSLRGTPVTDAGLLHLTAFENLNVLILDGTDITDAGLQTLSGMRRLQELSLSRTGITDAGLVHLQRMPKLRELELVDTSVTEQGVEILRKTLPDPYIRR